MTELLLVEWYDAAHPASDWQFPKDHKAPTISVVKSCGYLIARNDKGILLAGTVVFDKKGRVEQFTAEIHIPNGCIISERVVT